jgi:signal transduction histidine kinase
MTSPIAVLSLSPGAAGAASSRAVAWRHVRERILRVPLVVKVLGANLLIALAAVATAAGAGHAIFVAYIGAVLLIAMIINSFLVRVALLPLDAVQRVADRASRGERYARVTKSAIADRRIERLGTTLNKLLDEVNADHVHLHQSIRRSLAVREAERAEVAHELREATAQQVSALSLQLSVADRGFGRESGLTALCEARDIASRMLGDVRRLADSVYPGLLLELGLPASLAALAVRVRARSHLRVSVDVADAAPRLAPALVTAMYHVAEEALRNAEEHADARSVRVRLYTTDGTLHLDVHDDGKGFDAAEVERMTGGIGLFEARELLACAHGRLTIRSSPLIGTRVIASARLDQGET